MNAVFPSQIGKRLKTGANKDEITNLALMFNNLLDKAEEAFLNQKDFFPTFPMNLKTPFIGYNAIGGDAQYEKKSGRI